MADKMKLLKNNPKTTHRVKMTIFDIDLNIYFIDDAIEYHDGILPISVDSNGCNHNIFIANYELFNTVDQDIKFFVLCHEIGHIINKGKFKNHEEDEIEADKFAHKMLQEHEMVIDKQKADTLINYFEKVLNVKLNEKTKIEHYNRLNV